MTLAPWQVIFDEGIGGAYPSLRGLEWRSGARCDEVNHGVLSSYPAFAPKLASVLSWVPLSRADHLGF